MSKTHNQHFAEPIGEKEVKASMVFMLIRNISSGIKDFPVLTPTFWSIILHELFNLSETNFFYKNDVKKWYQLHRIIVRIK